MKIAIYLSAGGAVLTAFGLGFLLGPELLNPLYGLPATPHGLLQSRYFGGALLGYGLVIWLARHTRDDAVLCALLKGTIVGNVVGAALSLWALVSGLQNAMLLGPIALYIGFTVVALYFLASPQRRR